MEENKENSDSDSRSIDTKPLAVDDFMSQPYDDDLLSERSSLIDKENEMRRNKQTDKQIQHVHENIQS